MAGAFQTTFTLLCEVCVSFDCCKLICLFLFVNLFFLIICDVRFHSLPFAFIVSACWHAAKHVRLVNSLQKDKNDMSNPNASTDTPSVVEAMIERIKVENTTNILHDGVEDIQESEVRIHRDTCFEPNGEEREGNVAAAESIIGQKVSKRLFFIEVLSTLFFEQMFDRS